jgi:uridine phosphorylase
MGQVEEDFEKGDEAGSKAALEVVDASIEGWDTQPG